MKLCLVPLVLLLLTWPAVAQSDPGGPAQMPLSPPPAALQMEPQERQFFELGMTLSRGAFAYAELAKQASAVARTRSKIAQVGQLAKLDPVAGRNRAAACDQFTRAVALMHLLHAPPSALAPLTATVTRLTGPLPMTPDAQPVAFFSRSAARTLSALHEFETLSSLPEDPAIQCWLGSGSLSHAASVWYGEGEMAGLAQIAAAHQMPDLLPSPPQLATDLRGLRDWLSLRLPDTPSPEQIGLRTALDAFLEEVADAGRPSLKPHTLLTLAQLQALGSISSQLQRQVLGTSTAETAERF